MTDLEPIPDIRKNKAAWLKWKSSRIGGHDAATLLGVNRYQTLSQLYDRIVHGMVDRKTAKDEAFLSWRLAQEDLIADRYTDETGRPLRRTKSAYHPDNPRVISSVDREILKTGDSVGYLEIKSRDPMVWQRIKLEGAPTEDFAQTQHYLMVGRKSWGGICEANVSSGRQIRTDVKADPDFQTALMGRITDFLASCDRRERPPETAFPAVRMPMVGGELVTTDQMDVVLAGEFQGLAQAVTSSRDVLAEAKEYADAVKGAAQRWMTKNRFDVVEGFGVRIYYKEQAGRKTFDRKALASDHPDIDLTAYEIQGAPFKTFRVYDRKMAAIEGGRG